MTDTCLDDTPSHMHSIPLIRVHLAGPSTFLQRREAQGQRTGPGSRFKRQARLARLSAGPPGNNAQGGNICTLSPGGSQSFPFLLHGDRGCTNQRAALASLRFKGRDLSFYVRRGSSMTRLPDEAHLTPSDFQTLD